MSRQQAASPARSLLSAFTDHPHSVGETYPEHMGVAMRFGARLFCAGCAAIVHAVIPALFQTTASRTIEAMHADMKGRLRPKG